MDIRTLKEGDSYRETDDMGNEVMYKIISIQQDENTVRIITEKIED